eukprot:TRINITY_DN5838_c0_g1_i1.p2 TRINITY_DN5838_c0_g1~~TRINITY_DN5838_c0_g1_i1.p2  ORF type:complete len:133 (-),score=24.46 TRINITY_DN5838_c0_g1_i1:541-939(-)
MCIRDRICEMMRVTTFVQPKVKARTEGMRGNTANAHLAAHNAQAAGAIKRQRSAQQRHSRHSGAWLASSSRSSSLASGRPPPAPRCRVGAIVVVLASKYWKRTGFQRAQRSCCPCSHEQSASERHDYKHAVD